MLLPATCSLSHQSRNVSQNRKWYWYHKFFSETSHEDLLFLWSYILLSWNKGVAVLRHFPTPPPSPALINTSRYPGTSFQTSPVLSALWIPSSFQVLCMLLPRQRSSFSSVYLLLNSPVTVSGKEYFSSLDLRNRGSFFLLSPASTRVFESRVPRVSGFTEKRIKIFLWTWYYPETIVVGRSRAWYFPNHCFFYSDVDISICKLISKLKIFWIYCIRLEISDFLNFYYSFVCQYQS